MLNPWSYQKKNHTKILQEHITKKKLLDPEKSDTISLNEIIEYLNGVNGE